MKSNLLASGIRTRCGEIAAILVAVIGLGFATNGCGRSEEDIVAAYAGGEVSRSQYESWTRYRGVTATDPETVRAEVEQLVLMTSLAEDAQARGLPQTPEVRGALEDLENRVLSSALKRVVADEVEVTDQEIAALMDERPDAFQRPRKWRLRNIFRGLPDGASAEVRLGIEREMAGIRDRAIAGADFAELAKQHSESQSRFRGGLVGMVSLADLRPEVAAAAEGLSAGGVSEVIATDDGLTLLYCIQVVDEVVSSPEEVRAKLVSNLRRIKGKERWQAVEGELLESAAIQIVVPGGGDEGTGPESVVARYSGGAVTATALQRLLGRGRVELGALTENQIREGVESLVTTRLAAQRAREMGLDEDLTVERQLKWNGLQIVATHEVLARVRGRQTALTQEEIRAYFDANAAKFRRPDHYELELIQLALGDGDPRLVFRHVQGLLERVTVSNAAFAEIAAEHSIHRSAGDGGAVGWISRPQLVSLGPNVFNAIEGMRPGDPPELVRQDDNLWIARVTGFEAGRPLTYLEAAERAEAKLGNERIRELQIAIEQEVIAALGIRMTEIWVSAER